MDILKKVLIDDIIFDPSLDASAAVPAPVDVMRYIQSPPDLPSTDFVWWDESSSPGPYNSGFLMFQGNCQYPTHTTTVTTMRLEAATTNPHVQNSDEFFGSLSVYTPPGYQNDPLYEVIHQWHGWPGSPCISLRRQNGRLFWQVWTASSYNDQQVFDVGQIPASGEWTKFIYYLKFSDQLDGRFTVWRDGKIARLHGPDGEPYKAPREATPGIGTNYILKPTLGDLPYTVFEGGKEISILEWEGKTAQPGNVGNTDKYPKIGIYKSSITKSYITGGGLRSGWDDPLSEYFIPEVSRITRLGLGNFNLETRISDFSHRDIFTSIDPHREGPLETPSWWIEPEPPTATIISPANLSADFVAPADIVITTAVSDPEELLDKVEFYADDVKIGEVTAPPYNFTWEDVPAGDYVLTVKAVADEQSITSDPVLVTVAEPVPDPDPEPEPDPDPEPEPDPEPDDMDPPQVGELGFQLQVNGEFLELPADFSVQFNRFNPIFQTEGFKQDDYTLPISLPNSDHNARILGNPHIIENENRFPARMDAVIYFGGMPRVRGQLRIKSPVNSRVITVNFVSGVSEISPDIVNRKLRDVMDEEIVIHNIDWSRQITLRWRDEWSETYGIIINGVTYEEDDMMDFANSINNDPDCAATVHLEADGITATFIPKDPNELSEFWLDWVEGSIWTLVPSSFTPFWDAYNFIYSGYITGGWIEDKVRFPTNANLNGFVDITQASRWNAYPIVNYYTSSELLAANPIIQAPDRTSGRATSRPRVRNNNSIAPYVTVEYVLKQIADYYNITIKAPFTGAPDEMMIIDHPNTINRPVKYLGDSEMTLYARSFNLSSLVPDMNVNEFLKALQSLGYALEYDSAGRVLTYVKRDPALSQPGAIDFSDRAGMLEDFQNQPRQGVTLRHLLDNADRIIAEPVPLDADNGRKEYVIGDGEKLLESGFAVPVMLDNTGRFPKDSIVPKTVATKDMAADDNFKLRLAFSVTDANGIPRMQIANSEMNLSWYGTFGLANQSWKYWKALEAGKKEIAVKLYLTDAEVFDPPWFRKVLIDRNKYIISKLDADLSGSGDMIECEATLVKADYSKWLG